MTPWRVLRADFLVANAIPRFRKMIYASAKFPLASVRALLHSIMPAPVRSRSSFTSFALISITRFFLVLGFLVPSREPDRQSTASARLFGRAGRARRTSGRLRLFRRRALAGKRHGRQIFIRQTFRHELIQLLRIELRVF